MTLSINQIRIGIKVNKEVPLVAKSEIHKQSEIEVPTPTLTFSVAYNSPHREWLNRQLPNLKERWGNFAPRVLKKLSKTCCLDWEEAEIQIRLVRYLVSRSHPVIRLGIVEDVEETDATLVHEFTHRLVDNTKTNFDYLDEHFPNVENRSTKVHILIDTVLSRVYPEFFSPEVVEKIKEREKNWSPVYQEAWEIVDSLSEQEKDEILEQAILHEK